MTVQAPSNHFENDLRQVLGKFGVKREISAQTALWEEGGNNQPAVFILSGKAHIQYVAWKKFFPPHRRFAKCRII